MKCPKCGAEQAAGGIECQRCGVIFEKYHRYHAARAAAETGSGQTGNAATSRPGLLKAMVSYVEPETNPLVFGGRVLVFLLTAFWGLKFIAAGIEGNAAGQSFWHYVNLPFHEAGHVLFRPFGSLLASLGGTVGQLAIPLACLLVFLVKSRDTFAASFCLWWFGENLIDIAPYVNDARSLNLPLLGGNTGRTSPYGFHDWQFILTETGLIDHDHLLAGLAHGTGSLLVLAALAWGGHVLFRQYRNLSG